MVRSLGVRLESNGLYWTAAWTDSGGRIRRKSIGPKAGVSARLAQRRCDELAATLLQNPTARDAGKSPTLKAWLEQYAKLRTDLGEATMVNHRAASDRLLGHFGPDIRLDRINRASVVEFCAALQSGTFTRGKDAKSLSSFTIHKHISIAKQIFGYAMTMDLIPFNPFDRVKNPTPKMVTDWAYCTEADLAKILAACPDTDWRLRFALARLTGMRRNEIGRAEWGWIDWDARSIAVQPKTRQVTTKQDYRIVPLSPSIYAQLRDAFDVADEGDRLICGMPSANVERDAMRIVVRAGIKPWSKPLHTLRKNLVTDWLAKYPAPDVAKWLGHDEEVASKFYHQTKGETFDRVTENSRAAISQNSPKETVET